MKRNKGFTLAELLVVVAIIAVLVAISIPVFTSQLEKAREATDLANIRSAYAELMSAVITGDTEVDTTKSINNYSPLKSNSNIYYTTSADGQSLATYIVDVEMTQTQDDWQTANALESLKELFIGANGAGDDALKSVGKGKKATIQYTFSTNSSAQQKCQIYFS